MQLIHYKNPDTMSLLKFYRPHHLLMGSMSQVQNFIVVVESARNCFEFSRDLQSGIGQNGRGLEEQPQVCLQSPYLWLKLPLKKKNCTSIDGSWQVRLWFLAMSSVQVQLKYLLLLIHGVSCDILHPCIEYIKVWSERHLDTLTLNLKSKEFTCFNRYRLLEISIRRWNQNSEERKELRSMSQ